jgi:CTP-dependent riboflavin kinase
LESEEDKRKFESLKRREGIKIVPPNPNYCVAECFRVKVAGEVDGVIVIPKVDHYYTDIIEVVAPVQIKGKLGVQDGDLVTVEVKT